ncbi:hypothetical protein EAL2_c20730 [Peptoclostridium acidaminophilum DSM 3953]|uniref:Uncharacterized protein n=1 Tax=Peptoclostridium acidaminophilum DSM 3953 TaxID=1286171 RepID=W8T6H9_PEPAC|nr:cation:proton antiporter subunit C [Peptoclostridium acidaminophilum]AHM57354.1 hypothetical protein EAL2_c20730 [Peptoclostridium acidaminophilum DSM 3953]
MQILLSTAIVLIGFYGMCTSRNIIKSIVCLNISQAAIVLVFLRSVYFEGAALPIIGARSASEMVDPLPQALMITAIVIGASVTSLALMISIKLFRAYGSLDWRTLLERKDR